MTHPASSGSTAPWRGPVAAAVALVGLSIVAVGTPDVPLDGTSPAASSDAGAAGAVGSLDPVTDTESRVTSAAGDDEGGSVAAAGAAPGRAVGGAVSSDAPEAASCRAGANGGATDRGVTGDRVRLAATNVRSGVGASFLGTAYLGMQAVVNQVNSAGGICGRLLELRLVDDGWDAARGATFLQNFTKEDYFALPVVPSSEGLTQAIVNRTISSAGIPVVGSDGMLKEQYFDPWVWPVATATVSTVRIMTRHAWDAGARTFGIVYDQRYKFGLEGASAFRQYVRELTGADPAAFIGITPERPDYASDAKAFNDACGADGCQFVAMLLDPITANTYISSHADKDGRRQGMGTMLTGGAQPLFNERFARDCGRPCEGMLVWTGYNPPIGARASQPDVAEYVNAVRSVDPGVDVNNQFLEGAYLGMRVLVEALEAVGPNLTRAGLAAALDGLTFESDLAAPLRWGKGSRFANQSAQAFRVVTASGSFAGFADAGTGFLSDPSPGVVPS